MIEWLWLLLPVAAASGWWIAKREGGETSVYTPSREREPLDFSLDEPDRGLLSALQLLQISDEGADTHLLLGTLFRQRGDLSRAVYLHRHLADAPSLTLQQRRQALIALGEDFLSAGLFDRAEAVFQRLLRHPPEAEEALRRLLYLCECQRDWRRALDYCDKLSQYRASEVGLRAAHYHCELALESPDSEVAQAHLQQALWRDSGCVRASLALAQYALSQYDWEKAIDALRRIALQEPRYIPTALPSLYRAYEQLQKLEELMEYCRDLHGRYPSGQLTAFCVELLLQVDSAAAAIAWLEAVLPTAPTAAGLQALLRLRSQQGAKEWQLLHQASQRLFVNHELYRCGQCGHQTQVLQWQCPRCGHWGALFPAVDGLAYP